MPKLAFLKRNSIPSTANLNPAPLSAALVWMRIIYGAIAIVLLSVLLATFFMWKILKEQPLGPDTAGVDPNASVNKERLKEAVEIIKNRTP